MQPWAQEALRLGLDNLWFHPSHLWSSISCCKQWREKGSHATIFMPISMAERSSSCCLSMAGHPAFPDPLLSIFIVFLPNYTSRRDATTLKWIIRVKENPVPATALDVWDRKGALGLCWRPSGGQCWQISNANGVCRVWTEVVDGLSMTPCDWVIIKAPQVRSTRLRTLRTGSEHALFSQTWAGCRQHCELMLNSHIQV